MSTPIRILIALVFALIPGLFMPFDPSNVISIFFLIGVGIFGGGLVFFLMLILIPTQEELQQELEAEAVEEYHDSGKLKLSGKIIRGKKEQKWRHYNEKGKLVKVEVYNDGHLMRTIEGDDL